MNVRLQDLDELKLEDIEEFDYLLIWDFSEQKTKKVLIQTLMDYLKMLNNQ
jgi:hypothetical protein